MWAFKAPADFPWHGFLKSRLCFSTVICERIECSHYLTAVEHEEPLLHLQEINISVTKYLSSAITKEKLAWTFLPSACWTFCQISILVFAPLVKFIVEECLGCRCTIKVGYDLCFLLGKHFWMAELLYPIISSLKLIILRHEVADSPGQRNHNQPFYSCCTLPHLSKYLLS